MILTWTLAVSSTQTYVEEKGGFHVAWTCDDEWVCEESLRGAVTTISGDAATLTERKAANANR
jgi:hypothetical protein